MAPTTEHHHRSTSRVSHKPFKSRHATKSTLKEISKGKIEDGEKGSRTTPHQQVMSKLDRRNQAKQKRLVNHRQHEKATGVFSGKDGAPRIVAVVPLCEDVSVTNAIRRLNTSVDLDEDVPERGWLRVDVGRFKQKIGYVPVRRDVIAALDACRAADYVVFVLSAEQEVDELGELILRSVESQGISTVFTVVQGLDKVEPPKRRVPVAASLKSFITHFFPTQEKALSLDSRQECANLVRSLCTTTPKGIKWREDRSWMMVEEVRWPSGKSAMIDDAVGEVVLTGVVRGKGLKADRLVQVGDYGAFQVNQITAALLESHEKRRGETMAVDGEGQGELLEQPTEDQDDLNELAPEEVVMEDADEYSVSVASSERKGVLLDDHHYFSEEEEPEANRPKRLPKGTSKYQSAWYLEDVSDSGSDLEDVEADGDTDMGGPVQPADQTGLPDEDDFMREPTEAGPSEYPQSEIFPDASPAEEAEQLAAFRSQRRNEAEDDLEFPDEIELHSNVLARERLARYRGLKDFRTSVWELEEDAPYEPAEFRRLLSVANYGRAKRKAVDGALVGGVSPGTRVNIHLRGFPLSLQQTYNPEHPLTLFSLLRHEHKRTAAHFSITLKSDVDAPIKSKEGLIMVCGPRRFVINPLFSQAGNTPNDVHKFDRHLHPGRSAVASFIAPLTWGSVPALFFKRTAPSPEDLEAAATANGMSVEDPAAVPLKPPLTLIATGTSLSPSASRVIAKRIVLTGHPYKIHKKLVTVRYMFFNAEDVHWFKALQLWTKRGRSGFIKESLGTHGYFKATFDGKINPLDSVGMSLYKRVFPRSARALRPGEV